jgi:hypothetical protein
VDWIDLAQNKDKWRALLNTVMNIRIHNGQEISWLAERILGFQEGRCSMELG